MTLSQTLAQRIEDSLRAMSSVRDLLPDIVRACDIVLHALANGGTIYTAGNGGSAAQALHLAEELIGRYRADRPAKRAVCLNADPTALTCIANDFGFEHVFARQCEALLRAEDVQIVFSTSGRSANILRALEVARAQGAISIALLGRDGGEARSRSDLPIVIPAHDSAHIQDAHQLILHLICEAVETAGDL